MGILRVLLSLEADDVGKVAVARAAVTGHVVSFRDYKHLSMAGSWGSGASIVYPCVPTVLHTH